mmetsp:Transcript_22579/g.29509  ORF Transcript_22579/g.29509 Transcript_22579/m.29509 type:complete len:656 (+) Transcript_22579:27-1994(+)
MAAMVDHDEMELLAVAKLLDDLKHDDPQIRAKSTMQLPTIAAALGSERTREELIPFLMESTDDEDDILLAMAEQLGNLIDHIGGKDHVYHILNPLKHLSIVEDSAVRMKAIDSLLTCAHVLPNEHVQLYWFPLIMELKRHDYVTARITACSLCCVALGKLDSTGRQQVCGAFEELCGDHTPMVRRAAAESLGNFATCLAKEVTRELNDDNTEEAANQWTANQINRLIPMFIQLAMDDQDSVRLKTMENCIKLAKLFQLGEPINGQIAADAATNQGELKNSEGNTEMMTMEEILGRIYSTALACCGDPSWRIRWSLVAKLDEFIAVIGPSPRLVIAFQGLLADPDTEVRTAACGVVGKVGALVGFPALANQVLPALSVVVDDASDHVRVALAGSSCALATPLGREQTIARLLPMLLQLLRDNNSEVRLNIVGHLDEVNSVIGVDLLAQSLLPTIFELARDGKWRVRQAIIDHTPMLATQLGVDLFNERLVTQCIEWLHDDVFSVRTAAASNLRRLTELLGSEWCLMAIMPQLTAMSNRNDDGDTANVNMLTASSDEDPIHPFGHRMASLIAVASLTPALDSPSLVESHVLPIVIKLCRDPIPNIRFNSAKTLEHILSSVSSSAITNTVIPCLEGMLQDSDRDVRHFAGRALLAAKS